MPPTQQTDTVPDMKQVECDDELVRLAQSGDTKAFSVLVERYEKRIFRVAQSIAHNREDAEDVSQNVFFKAFEALPSFEGRARFSTWLTRIAVNESLMQLRRRRAVMVSLDHPASDEPAAIQLRDPKPSPEQLCSQGELRQFLTAALDQLRPAMRIVFVLRDMEGLTCEETAEVLGLTVSAVKTRLSRARSVLRGRLLLSRHSSLDGTLLPDGVRTFLPRRLRDDRKRPVPEGSGVRPICGRGEPSIAEADVRLAGYP
jgi:RNA polymerase sigma-70 factor, ECF subfamily